MSNYSQGDFNSFCALINDTMTLFDDIIGLENKKVDAISENDVNLLDQYMNDEQAFLLKMRGLDYKREKVQEQLGMPGKSFKQMADGFDKPERETLDTLYCELSSKSTELKEAVSSTKRYIDLHLASISSLLEKFEGTTYSKSGEKGQTLPSARFTPVKI